MKVHTYIRLPWISILIISFASSSFAQSADTPEARRLAVQRYFQLVPMKMVWSETTEEVAKSIPAEQRERFIAMMKATDLSRLEAAAGESLAKHLTLKEIQAFVAFMELPEGQSAMKRMKFYMADLMPVLQSEIQRVAEKALK